MAAGHLEVAAVEVAAVAGKPRHRLPGYRKQVFLGIIRGMSYRNDRTKYLLLARVFILLAFIGIGILIFTNLGHDPSQIAFSLIAYVISVAALIMTTLQSLSISRQVQTTERAARLVHETAQQLKALVAEDHRLEREIRQDIRLDHEIIAILEEHGVGNSDAERHQVATRIAQKLTPAANGVVKKH